MGTDAALERILDFARSRDDIRLAILNGSRANPRREPDRWADWDIVFASTAPLRYDVRREWIEGFGTLLISQMNSRAFSGRSWSIHLLQYSDGFRLDAQFVPLEAIPHILEDSLSKILLDKDGMIPKGLEPSEESYLCRRPDQETFLKTVNEFWWSSLGVAKGLARGELCHAAYLFEAVVRKAFLDILSWHASSLHGWKANPGTYGRFLLGLIPEELNERVRLSYAGRDVADRWTSLMGACDIISELEIMLRLELGVPGRAEDALGILRLMERMRRDSISDGGKNMEPPRRPSRSAESASPVFPVPLQRTQGL